ncbi:hypothetical protein NYR58_19410, partial [Chelativorans intermedius]|nr:hypothetical protein [Chelativorans intermedius]
RLFAIVVLLHGQNHTSRWTRSMGVDQMRLLSPIDGAQALERMLADGSADARTFRPVAMTPALLVGLDRAKREIFLEEWRAALPRGGMAAGSR